MQTHNAQAENVYEQLKIIPITLEKIERLVLNNNESFS